MAELRPVTKGEIEAGAGKISLLAGISVSQEDIRAGSPKEGDMIAINPKNHNDMWLVAGEYFKDNFESTEKEIVWSTTFPEDNNTKK